MEPTQNGQQIIQQYLQLQFINPKSSLCRYYLRGGCFFPKEICKYSHGVEDLKFGPYAEEPIIWKYERTDYNQTKFIPKVRKYTVLYDYQQQKQFTQQQIDSDRAIRMALRQKFFRQECQKFLALLRTIYPDEEFTSEFIEREFTRVGFNKPTSTISFKKIASYLSGPNSQYFVAKINNKDIILKKKTDQQTSEYFGNLLYQFVVKNKTSKILQSQLKKQMFKVKDKQYPPLNSILKQKQMPFVSYVNQMFSAHQPLRQYVCNNDICIQSQSNIEELTVTALQYLSEAPKIIPLDKMIQHVMQTHKINNTNPVNPLKYIILEHQYRLFYLPMVAFIYNQNSQKQICLPQCPCTWKQQPDLSFFPAPEVQIALQKIQIIDSQESFEKCLHAFIGSSILAVDIEGRLRKKGHIEVIQCNNGQNIFLFDIYKITQITFNFELFQAIKMAIRKVMLDDNILKIFHDSRHDCLALHEFINTCTRNVFDTSGMEVIINQLGVYSKNNQHDNAFINQLANIKTPGLNDLFKKYEAPHGINKSKDKFHHLMSISEVNVFHQRPFNEEYKQYCIKDVLDLIYLQQVMSKLVPKQLIQYVGNHYVINSFEGTL